jgi:large subunit ribosomal protein L7/L12
MGSDRLGKLLEQREVMNARIRREQAKAKSQARKDDTRRKILAGAAVIERAARDTAFKSELDGLLEGFLTRPDDRALFGLAVPAKAAEGEAAIGGAPSGDMGASVRAA